ncbi:YcnI family protein [Microbacterium lacus]|uniref:YcnI family protein n=1 Tax=Microbacterium lacus TaxID=415217 RepID=UPI000C2BB106|nr:YcnI family protein [Microbacterium lacus]
MNSTTPAPTRSTRRRFGARAAAAVLASAALVVAAPLAAQAHVTATPDAATAGGYGTLTFAFSHGCDGSPTTALEITIPEGMSSVSPTIAPGWDIDVQRDGEDGPVSLVTYTAQQPVEDGLRATVVLGVQYAEDTAGETLAFPVNQVCEVGNTDWAEIAEDGVDPHSLDAPAPTVTVGEATSDEHGSDHSDAEHSDSDAEDMTDASATASTEASALPIVLGGAGLLLGAGALVVALLAFRRTRS